MRLIDADALINEAGKLWSEMPDGEELSKELMKAINHAPTVATDTNVPSKWISVKDRLPEESGKVLVYCKDGYMTDVNYSAKHQQFNNYDVCAKQNEVWDVTHWMPLPTPPEEVTWDG